MHTGTKIVKAPQKPKGVELAPPVIKNYYFFKNVHKFSFISYFYLFIYLFLAALGLCCCTRAFSSCGKRGLLFVAVHGLLIVVASIVAEHGLQAHGLQQFWHVDSVVVARGLQGAGSVVVAHGLRSSMACGIFSDQGLNLCPLHQQGDSQPLHHQVSPIKNY